MSKTFSTADVAAHNKPTDLFIVVDEDVYDLTAFQDEHPGELLFPKERLDLSCLRASSAPALRPPFSAYFFPLCLCRHPVPPIISADILPLSLPPSIYY